MREKDLGSLRATLQQREWDLEVARRKLFSVIGLHQDDTETIAGFSSNGGDGSHEGSPPEPTADTPTDAAERTTSAAQMLPDPAGEQDGPAGADADAETATESEDMDTDDSSGKVRVTSAATERPGQEDVAADDLTLIRGVGPTLAGILTEAGITRFEQIAQWSDEDADEFAAQLGRFRGRVRRDSWVTEAQRLVAEKAGSEEQPTTDTSASGRT